MAAILTMAPTIRQRKEDVFDYICDFAETNATPPSVTEIAGALDLSKQRVSYLMMRLALDGRVVWLTRYTYTVTRATWERPPE